MRYTREMFRGDLAGGLAAAALTVPVSAALGMFTVGPLGAEALPLGVSAGVIGAALCSLMVVLLGSRSSAVLVPRSVTAVFVAGMLLELAAVHRAQTGELPGPAFVYAATFLFLALSGAFQALIGLLRLGGLVKYLPHAVLAGFMNAVAVLLILGQAGALAGLPHGSTLADLIAAPGKARPLALVVAAVTFAVYWAVRLYAPRLQPLLTALAAGSLTHFALGAAGHQGALGPTLAGGASALPELGTAAQFPELIHHVAFAAALPGIATAALGLALIGSLDFLLQLKAHESAAGTRVDAQRELARLGLANTAAACAGCIPCGMSLGATRESAASGARTAVSVLVHGAVALVAALVLAPLVPHLPDAALGALLVAIGIGVIDRASLASLRRLAVGEARNRGHLAADALVMLTVTAVTLLASMALAVAAGMAIAVLVFIATMSRSTVRRVYRGGAARSRRMLPARQAAALEGLAPRIVVIEIEGVLFFGTVDDLMARVDALLREDCSHVILDLRRATDVDTTGAQMLAQLGNHVRGAGRSFIVAGVAEGEPLWELFVDTGVLRRLGAAALAPDVDRALERAENDLLAAMPDERSEDREIPLQRLAPFEALSAAELDPLRKLLERREFSPGDTVFREGEPGTGLYLIVQGTASVSREEGGRAHRLITFAPGTVFGEMGLLERQPRSATVRADERLVCYLLSNDRFDALVATQHTVAVKLVAGLARELGRRVRLANHTIDGLLA